jgi:solute carrier family 35 protein F5
MAAPNKQLDWGERNAIDDSCLLQRCISTSDEYEPLVNEDETPHHTVSPGSTSDALPPLTTRETAQLASVFCFVWFLANWTLSASLGLTSVASATILSSMSGV